MADTLTDLKRIRPGDFACLTDEVTIKDLMERGVPNATDGLQLEVESVYHIREKGGICEWFLCPLKGGPEGYIKLYLFLKVVGDVHDKRIYWVPDDFANPRTKGDLVRDGVLHIFKEPPNPHHFRACDLEFTGWIDLNTDGRTIKYDVKGGTLFGECRQKPVPTGVKQPEFASVTEYITDDQDAEDSEILIIELGGLDDEGEPVDAGGVVYYFHGGPVNDNDLHLIQQ